MNASRYHLKILHTCWFPDYNLRMFELYCITFCALIIGGKRKVEIEIEPSVSTSVGQQLKIGGFGAIWYFPDDGLRRPHISRYLSKILHTYH